MKHLALPKRLPRTKRSITAVVVASLLLVGVLAAAREATTRPTTVTAYFHDSTGVYAGDEVRILGVPVGRIDKITPEKDRVKLVFWGLCLLCKRLEDGKFRWPRVQDGVMRLSAAQLSALLEGLDWSRVHARRVMPPQAVQ